MFYHEIPAPIPLLPRPWLFYQTGLEGCEVNDYAPFYRWVASTVQECGGNAALYLAQCSCGLEQKWSLTSGLDRMAACQAQNDSNTFNDDAAFHGFAFISTAIH